MKAQHRQEIRNFYLSLHNLNVKFGNSYVGPLLKRTSLKYEEVICYSASRSRDPEFLFKFNNSRSSYYELHEITFHISEKPYIEKQYSSLSFYSYSYLIEKIKYYD